MSTSIGIYLFDGAEELDWAGPWEVLAAWAQQHLEDQVNVFTFADRLAPIRCAKGLQVLPQCSRHDLDSLDVLIVPGGQGVASFRGDTERLSWLADQHRNGALVASVCTGALVLAAAGLLDGRPATTHWGALDILPTLGSEVEVRPDERYVDTGDIITAGGVSAGIDMALHLIRRLHSVERAQEVRRYIQYDPQPPI